MITDTRADLAQYKSRLREYLVKRGIKITKTDADRIECLNETHPHDVHASMIVYKSNLYCPVCGAKMDIFEAARAIAGVPSGDNNFPKVIEEVKSTLGIFAMSADAPVAAAPAKKHVEKNTTFVSLPLDEARHYYVESTVLELASKSLRAKVEHIENTWKNIDTEGKIAFIECRFPASDFEDGKKKYLTFWFDGERVRAANPPYLLYNRDKLAANSDLPVVIHEGPKCVFIAEKDIQGFIHTGWNSGGKKFALVDFEPLRGKKVIIYPDDDGPGRKTALEVYDLIKSITATCRICEPLAEARSIKPQGSDIVEALQVRTPEEMAEYFRAGLELDKEYVEEINRESGVILSSNKTRQYSSISIPLTPPFNSYLQSPMFSSENLSKKILDNVDSRAARILQPIIAKAIQRASSLGIENTQLDDATNASLFCALYKGYICFVPGSTWRVYDSEHGLWITDDDKNYVKRLGVGVGLLRRESISLSEDSKEFSKFTKYTLSSYGVKCMLDLAASEPLLIYERERFDRDLDAVLDANGQYINLKSGSVRLATAEDCFTRSLGATYNPNSTCPVFNHFILEAMENDSSAVEFLQRWGRVLFNRTDERTKNCHKRWGRS